MPTKGLAFISAVASSALVLWQLLAPGPLCQHARAEESFFKPGFEFTPTKKPSGPQAIFSFGRFEPDFRAICIEMELDGRRERLVWIAEAGVKRERECISCRAFWRSIVAACGRVGTKPKQAAVVKKKAVEEGAPSAEVQAEGASEELPVTPTAAAVLRERRPSTPLIDLTSSLSTKAFELDQGDGTIAEMFRYLDSTMRGVSDLSTGEREYYDIFLTYLLAAWAGRIDPAQLPRPTAGAEIDEFFE